MRPNHFDFVQQLECFFYLAEEKSMKAASLRSGIAESKIRTSVTRLEQIYDGALFKYSGHIYKQSDYDLTHLGESLHLNAKNILSKIETTMEMDNKSISDNRITTFLDPFFGDLFSSIVEFFDYDDASHFVKSQDFEKKYPVGSTAMKDSFLASIEPVYKKGPVSPRYKFGLSWLSQEGDDTAQEGFYKLAVRPIGCKLRNAVLGRLNELGIDYRIAIESDCPDILAEAVSKGCMVPVPEHFVKGRHTHAVLNEITSSIVMSFRIQTLTQDLSDAGKAYKGFVAESLDDTGIRKSLASA